MSAWPDRVARNTGAGSYAARPEDAGIQGEAPGARPSHEALVQSLAPSLHAVLQIAGRAVGARAHEAGARARAQGSMDPQARAAPAWVAGGPASVPPADGPAGTPPGLHEDRADPAATVLRRQGPGSGRNPGENPGGGGGGGGGDPDSSAPATSRREPLPPTGPPAGARQEVAAHPQRAARDVQRRDQAAKDQAIETALRQEYETELALLNRRRQERKAALSGGMQHAVLDHNHAMLRVLQELLVQLDTDFNALEAALRERISQAWVARAPASAKAPRPGARTPAEQREINELLQVLCKRRSGVRRLLRDSVRSACLLHATGALGLMMEWYRSIEDELLDLELNPVTTRRREAEARFVQARTQRDQARLQLGQDVRTACEADPAGMLGLLVELRRAMEEHHHDRLLALRPR